jgi:hypothetical protein
MKIYSGIGSRETPPIEIGILEAKIAYKLATLGWILRSGGAYGSDLFFEYGARQAKGNLEIYTIRTEEKNKDPARNIQEAQWAWKIDDLLPWDRLKDNTKMLFRRNVNQVLGTPERPILSKFVIYWTPIKDIYKKEAGGTRIAARIADKHHIPLYNLLDIDVQSRFEKFVEDVKWQPDPSEIWKRTKIKQTSLFL